MKKCYHPWVGLDISPQGQFKPCCKFNEILGNSFEEYENNPKLHQLRSDFENGILNEGCSRCWKDEEAKLPSKRTLDNQYIFNNQAPDLTSIKIASIPFGNVCNLACRICSSYSSSKWGVESKKIADLVPDIVVYDHNQYYKNKNFMDSIIDKCSELIHLEIPGGEPFYATTEIHYDFLKRVKAKSVHYITNCTIFPEKELLDLWSKFEKVDVQLSLDGIEDVFEYNRWPAKWDVVKDNIVKWQNLKLSNLKLSISHSVSVFTISELPEFLNWCKEQNLPDPYLGIVTTPAFYNITILPKSVKEWLTTKLDGHPIVNHLWSSDDSIYLDKFQKYVNILDKQRQQSFAETFPKLQQFLKMEWVADE